MIIIIKQVKLRIYFIKYLTVMILTGTVIGCALESPFWVTIQIKLNKLYFQQYHTNIYIKSQSFIEKHISEKQLDDKRDNLIFIPEAHSIWNRIQCS